METINGLLTVADKGVEHITFTLADVLWLLGFIVVIATVIKLFTSRKDKATALLIKDNADKLNETIANVRTLNAIETQIASLIASVTRIEHMLDKSSEEIKLLTEYRVESKGSIKAAWTQIDKNSADIVKIENNCFEVQKDKNK